MIAMNVLHLHGGSDSRARKQWQQNIISSSKASGQVDIEWIGGAFNSSQNASLNQNKSSSNVWQCRDRE